MKGRNTQWRAWQVQRTGEGKVLGVLQDPQGRERGELERAAGAVGGPVEDRGL